MYRKFLFFLKLKESPICRNEDPALYQFISFVYFRDFIKGMIFFLFKSQKLKYLIIDLLI